jgi:HK97 family phage major capsid protein
MDPRAELRKMSGPRTVQGTQRSFELRTEKREILKGWARLLAEADRHHLSRSVRQREIGPTARRAEEAVRKLDAEIAAEERGQPPEVNPAEFRDGIPTLDDLGHDGKVPLLGREQRMADWVDRRGGGGFSGGMLSEWEDPDRFSLGRTIRGYVLGDWRDADMERRALSEGVNANGGFLLPSPLSSRVIDRIRNKMQVVNAGATVVPMETPTLALPRLVSGATPAWHAEAGSVTASDEQFDRVTFTAKTVVTLVLMSRELFEDVPPESAQLVEAEILRGVALEIDRVCLRGSGASNQPTGVLNQSGVTITSLGANGATPTYDSVIDSVSRCRNNNIEPNAILWAPRTAQTLGKAKDSQNRYLDPPAVIDGVQRLTTNQIPTNLTVGTSNDCSEIYTADWANLLIGWRVGVGFGIQAPGGPPGDNSSSFNTSGVAVLQERWSDTLSVGLLCYARIDVQLAHPAGFDLITGVRP